MCTVEATATITVASTAPMTLTASFDGEGCVGGACDRIGFSFYTPMAVPSGCFVVVNGPLKPMTIALPSPAVDVSCGDGETLKSGTSTIETVGPDNLRASYSLDVTTGDGTTIEFTDGLVTVVHCGSVTSCA